VYEKNGKNNITMKNTSPIIMKSCILFFLSLPPLLSCQSYPTFKKLVNEAPGNPNPQKPQLPWIEKRTYFAG
jgi:hypothetical protein